MKILHIVYNCIPGRYRGGIPKMVAELSHEQYKLGHQVFIYTTDYNLYVKETVPYNEDVVFNGAKIRFFRGFLHPCWRSPEMRRHLLQSAWQFDVLHGHNTFLSFNRYTAAAARRTGRPCFFHAHGALDPIVLQRGFCRRLKKFAYIRLFETPLMNAA